MLEFAIAAIAEQCCPPSAEAIATISAAGVICRATYKLARRCGKSTRKNKRVAREWSSHPVILAASADLQIFVHNDPARERLFNFVRIDIIHAATATAISHTLIETIARETTPLTRIPPVRAFSWLRATREAISREQMRVMCERVPAPIRGVVGGVLHLYHTWIDRVIAIVQTHETNRSVREIVTQFLDLTQLAVLMTVQEWRASAMRLNGQLSGEMFDGERIRVSCSRDFVQLREAFVPLAACLSLAAPSVTFTFLDTHGAIAAFVRPPRAPLHDADFLRNGLDAIPATPANALITTFASSIDRTILGECTVEGRAAVIHTDIVHITPLPLDIPMGHVAVTATIVGGDAHARVAHVLNCVLVSALTRNEATLVVGRTTGNGGGRSPVGSMRVVSVHGTEAGKRAPFVVDQLRVTPINLQRLLAQCEKPSPLPDALESSQLTYGTARELFHAEAWRIDETFFAVVYRRVLAVPDV